MILDTILAVGLLIVLCCWADTVFELRSVREKLAALEAKRFPEFDIAPRDQA